MFLAGCLGVRALQSIAAAAHWLTSLTTMNKCSASTRLWRIPCGLKCNHFSSDSILLSHSSPLKSLTVLQHCSLTETEWTDGIARLWAVKR